MTDRELLTKLYAAKVKEHGALVRRLARESYRALDLNPEILKAMYIAEGINLALDALEKNAQGILTS